MKHALVVVPMVVVVATALALSVTCRQVVFYLSFGWAAYLWRILPEVAVRWDGVALFLGGLAVFTLLLHWIATWLRREMSEPAAAWHWRSTLLVVGLVMTMFVACIALVGMTHQILWLAKEDAQLLSPVLPSGFGASKDANLSLMALSLHNFHDEFDRLPTRSPIVPDQAEQSWITQILPYAGFTSNIDLKKPWDHADNQSEIRKLVPIMLNPGLRPLVLRDASGYGVSHYAGNTHLFDHPARLSLSDIGDGTANTLLIGEVCADFQPWAKPRTSRDPALGINGSPKGFGGPAANGGTRFVMADGSVRFFSRDVDPAILRVLGTPNGHEPINGALQQR